jgi:hypothetical protein
MKGTKLMTGSVAVILGLSLVIVLTITVFRLVRRRPSNPKARYQRDIRALRTSTYLRTEPRPARQSGADGLEFKYGGGAWLS